MREYFLGELTEEEIQKLVKNEVDVPEDALQPKWNEKHRCHNWHNYVNDLMIEEWPNFTPYQRAIIAGNCEGEAGREDWDRD